ncbi:solute carrier organic anion transporter family member 4C1 [Anopheles maculipalpis]|uniref:solute carrier organic anion transporter family member 4C1 n=1 Tax=Anopheles maculipalpis TaxID=1496333 RepID=UPI0021591405|nr:solute carrier organic anion transporter family member 4C1 [Anopheles maculipalpis]
MMRQESLLSNHDRQPRIEANANNIKQDSIDCGVTACSCCNGPGCIRLGTATSFVICLSLVAFVSGGIESYFRLAAHQAASELSFDPIVLDWLLVTAGVAQGAFALLVSYWGNRLHRISWLGGIFMLQAISLIVLIIPTLTHNSEESNTIESMNLDKTCTLEQSSKLVMDRPYAITTLVLMFIAQVLIGLANVAIYALGISYVDDNVRTHHSPGLIGCVIAARIWGAQLGLAIGLAVGATTLGWWLGWAIIGPLTFVLGFIISLFPKRLLATMVRQAANDIVETATNNSMQSIATADKWLADISLWSTVRRVFSNKVLICNVLALVFIQTGMVNFHSHEQSYLQSRFFLPTSQADGINDEWASRLITNLIRPFAAAMGVIVAALVIASANPSARKLAGWNIFVGILATGLFIAYIFISCGEEQIAGAYRGRKLIKPFCASNCVCAENVPFTPVCPIDSRFTYFSPCHAGCQDREEINSIVIYRNCSCGVDVDIVLDNGGDATEGACGIDDCQPYWIVFQVLTVIVAMLLASGLTGKVIISLRSVLTQDKSMALAVELTLVGLVVYLPGTAIYQVVATHTCQFWSSNERQCFLHETPTFGNILNMITAALIIIGLIFEMVVFYFVKDMSLYGENDETFLRDPIEMRFISPARTQTMTEMMPLNNAEDTTRHTADRSTTSETLVQSATLIADEDVPSVQTIQNTQPSYPTVRSISPLAASSATYAQVVRQLPKRENSSEIDEQLDFRSATSLPRGQTDSDDESDYRSSMVGPMKQQQPVSNSRADSALRRDYTRNGLFSPRAISPESPDSGRDALAVRSRNVPGRPMSPETDF